MSIANSRVLLCSALILSSAFSWAQGAKLSDHDTNRPRPINTGPSAATKRVIQEYLAELIKLGEEGKFEQVESVARQGLSSLPNADAASLASLKTYLGEALIRQGQLREALQVEQEANAVLHDQGTYLRVGYLLCALGRADDSAKLFKPAVLLYSIGDSPSDYVKAAPSVADKASLQGAWLLAIGLSRWPDGDGAQRFYLESAQKFLPRNALLASELGDIHLKNKELALASKNYQIAVRYGTGTLKALAQRGVNLARSMAREQPGRPRGGG